MAVVICMSQSTRTRSYWRGRETEKCRHNKVGGLKRLLLQLRRRQQQQQQPPPPPPPCECLEYYPWWCSCGCCVPVATEEDCLCCSRLRLQQTVFDCVGRPAYCCESTVVARISPSSSPSRRSLCCLQTFFHVPYTGKGDPDHTDLRPRPIIHLNHVVEWAGHFKDKDVPAALTRHHNLPQGLVGSKEADGSFDMIP